LTVQCTQALGIDTYLVGSTALVGTKHDHVGSGVGELLLVELLVLLEELEIGTTTHQGVLRLDFILDHQGLALVVNLLGELGRDGVVGGRVLHHQTLVALNSLEDGGLLNSPLANEGPVLIGLGVVLLRVRELPPGLPVVGELLQEGSLERSRLDRVRRVNEGSIAKWVLNIQ
jgi:hypothetical protein